MVDTLSTTSLRTDMVSLSWMPIWLVTYSALKFFYVWLSTAYMLLCEESVPREIAFSFLDRVKDEFVAKCGTKANAAPALGLNKEFRCVIFLSFTEYKSLSFLIQSSPLALL